MHNKIVEKAAEKRNMLLERNKREYSQSSSEKDYQLIDESDQSEKSEKSKSSSISYISSSQ